MFLKLHPVNQLAFWLWLTSWLPWLERQWLYGVAMIVVIWTLLVARERFFRAMPRVRWLLIALGAVYGWTTPGQYVWSGWFAPTQEGILLGLAQVTRLLVIVASLQVLLTNMKRPAIFAGLHAFMRPLGWFGLSRDRMALRLALTLEMMEKLLETRLSVRHLIFELQQPVEQHAAREVLLPVVSMSVLQQVLLAAQMVGILAMLWLGGYGSWA